MTGLLPTVGSLFSGYDGIGLGLEKVVGPTRTAWFSEHDPKAKKPADQGAARILAHHWPTVPNLGDLTTIDWTTVEPVDIITGGFPCQDLSLAGKQAGMAEGTRSGLWSHMAAAIETIRPRLAIAENVRGLLSGKAHSADQRCPGCVEGGPGGHVRALGVVLGDLARIGYDAQWIGLRASDVGAPHQRFRVFVVAHLRDAEMRRRNSGAAGPPEVGQGPARGSNRSAATDADDIGRNRRAGFVRPGGWGQPTNSGDIAPDAEGNERWVSDGDGRASPDPDRDGRERIKWVDTVECDTDGRHCQDVAGEQSEPSAPLADTDDRARHGQRSRPVSGEGSSVDWGRYGPAIDRWAPVVGRGAPAPTQTGSRGGQQLSPRFVEWMMGLPEGHVTDPAIGLSRSQQLKALGNGVVPQQAEAAIRHLLQVAAA